MLIFHPIRAFKIADEGYDFWPFFVALSIAFFWAFLVVGLFVLVASIVSAEIGYGDWHCAFADCKRIYIQDKR